MLNLLSETSVIKNRKVKKFVATLLGCSLYFQDAMATASKTKGPDALGWKLLTMFRHWAKWVLLLMCVGEIAFSASKGNSDKTLSIIMRYLFIYIAMFVVPIIYDEVERAFS